MMLKEIENIMSLKKQNIYKSNHKQELTTKIKGMRSQLLKIHDNNLNALIKVSETNLTYTIILQLLEYAHKDQQNAIIQLGNLIISNKEVAVCIKDILSPKNNDYWTWLIKIMVYSKQTNEHIYDYIIKKIEANISNFGIINLLDALSELTNNQMVCEYFLQSDKTILTIAKYMESTKQEIYFPAFKIFSNFLSFNQRFTDSLLLILGNNIDYLFKIGLLKSDYEIKALTSQSLANCALNRPVGETILDIISLKARKQKFGIMKQISYYFINLMQKIEIQKIEAIFRKHLIEILNKYFQSNNNQLIQNSCQILKKILLRFRNINDQISFSACVSFLHMNGFIQQIRKFYDIDNSVDDMNFLLDYTS